MMYPKVKYTGLDHTPPPAKDWDQVEVLYQHKHQKELKYFMFFTFSKY